MFDVAYSNQAHKFLKKVSKILAKRILDKIEKLRKKPINHDAKRVKGEKLFRVRIGKYRILYEVDYKENLIGIIKIDKRSKAYQ